METFNINTEFSRYENCYLEYTHYCADNSLYVAVVNDEFGPIATLTVCIPDSNLNLVNNEAFIDLNNCYWAAGLVEHLGIAQPTRWKATSGFCTYPLYEFDVSKLKQFGREM